MSSSDNWTVESLRQHLLALHDNLKIMLQERYETQTKAVDAAFLAQQTAMSTALTAAERAVQAALVSAEKAVTKAEIASDKRFEATNEFRQQLSDQAATFISRSEADTRIIALGDRLDSKFEVETGRVTRVENQVSNIQGRMIAYAAIGAVVGSVITAIILQIIS